MNLEVHGNINVRSVASQTMFSAVGSDGSKLVWLVCFPGMIKAA
jgi:hypothetical protein